MTTIAESSAAHDVGDSKQNPTRWATKMPPLSTAARTLLEDYSHIPADQVESHIERIRQKAFVVCPYPCIGHVRFLDLNLHSSKARDEVVSRVRDGERYLDLGCCFGQEIRYLVSQGCPSENIYGADLRQVFIDYGYELFGDKDTLKAKFLAPADIFAEEPLSQLDGSVDIVNASSFFHLFSWDASITVAKRVVGFLKPVKGSLIVGRQVGKTSGASSKGDSVDDNAFRHDSGSWKDMWRDVGEATDSRWDVDFWWDESAGGKIAMSANSQDIRRFCFVIRRL